MCDLCACVHTQGTSGDASGVACRYSVTCRCGVWRVACRCVVWPAAVLCNLPLWRVACRCVVWPAAVLCGLPLCCVACRCGVWPAAVLCGCRCGVWPAAVLCGMPRWRVVCICDGHKLLVNVPSQGPRTWNQLHFNSHQQQSAKVSEDRHLEPFTRYNYHVF